MLLIVAVSGCTPECRQPDTSNVAVEVQPARLDEALWQANRADLDGANRELLQEFGAFYAIYVRDILRLGAPEDPGMGVRLGGFLSDATIRDVFETCAAEFADLSMETATLEQALRNYAHYFPERQVPQVVTCMSGFNYSVIATEDVLAVSLEMYLGAGSEYYRRQGLPAYQVRHMHREHLAMDALRAWLATEFPLPANEKELVTHMVHEGKLLYLMDAVFPCAPDSLK
ncbi:MAG: hypothetical protein AAGB22_15130, partial [Bacteroidota bacterium]